MAVSSSALVQRVRDLLNDQPYTTTSTTTTTSSTVTVPDASIWSPGDVLEWQTGTVGFEQALVLTSDNVVTLTATRGYGGTTAETHTSGDAVVQNPSFYGRQVQQAINVAVRGLWPFVYKTQVLATITPDSTKVWYDLVGATVPVGIVRVMQVYNAVTGGSLASMQYYGARGNLPLSWDFQLPTSLVATGFGIRFPSGLAHATNVFTVVTQQVVTGTSDIEDDGHFPVADSCVYSAAGRIVQALEIPRVSVGADLETSGTVGTGSRLQTGSYYVNLGKQKLEELALKYREYYQPLR